MENVKSIIQAMLEEIYLKSIQTARSNKQTVGEKSDYYITLEQLEVILKEFEG